MIFPLAIFFFNEGNSLIIFRYLGPPKCGLRGNPVFLYSQLECSFKFSTISFDLLSCQLSAIVMGMILFLSQNKKVDRCTDSPIDIIGLLLAFTAFFIKTIQALSISTASHSI